MSTAKLETTVKKGVYKFFWEGLAEDEDGDAAFVGGLTDLCAQLTGTFSSETVTIQGSVDGVNFVALNDLQDGSLAFTGAGLSAIQERPLWIRPSCGTGGGAGTVDVDISISGMRPV